MNTQKKSTQLSFIGIFTLMIASSLTIMVGSAIVPAIPQIGEHFQLGNQVSWLVTIPALGVVLFAVFSGKLIDKIGAYTMMLYGLIGFALFGVCGFLMPTIQLLFLDRLFLGAATATVMASSTDLISQFFEGAKRLRMIAIQGMAIELGGVFF